ncbi:MAG TPA: lysophospholipid acyltransferase family protein [Candidatus Limnocylindrales bacterium]|nr:lysophospholipid acyltransferase family protein [Candidatus Limnocylindrales bacterium]
MKSPVWSLAMQVSRPLVRLLARFEVTGAVAGGEKPLIVASNHISPFDPVVLTAACHMRGLDPAFLAHDGPFRTPILGAFLRHSGHVRVDRGTAEAPLALLGAQQALAAGRTVVIYPEGRISRDPGLWPERGKTGVGRLVLASRATVVPAAVWGAHEIVPYDAPRGMWPFLWRNLTRRPATVRVHFGAPLELSDVDLTRVGAAQRITDRITDAIIDCLAPLRADEPDSPRFTDPTRVIETRRSYRRKTPS